LERVSFFRDEGRGARDEKKVRVARREEEKKGRGKRFELRVARRR
jgi:hypothetical protein